MALNQGLRLSSITMGSWGFVIHPTEQPVERNSLFHSSSLKPSCTPVCTHPTQNLVSGWGGEGPEAAEPWGGNSGSALPAAPCLWNLPLAAKDTHVCIKLLSSRSNSGTSDGNYRYITSADKSGARQLVSTELQTPRGEPGGVTSSPTRSRLCFGDRSMLPRDPPWHRCCSITRGTRKGHRAQLPSLHRTTSKFTPCETADGP